MKNDDWSDTIAIAEQMLAETPTRRTDYWERIDAALDDIAPDQLCDLEAARVTVLGETPTPVVSGRVGRARWMNSLAIVGAAAALILMVWVVGNRGFEREVPNELAVGAAAELSVEEALIPPRLNRDHWNSVYAVWDCTLNDGVGDWVPPFQSTSDEFGIHSHGNGLISIHPFFPESSGPNATFSHFANEMDIEVTNDFIRLDDGKTLTEGELCSGEPATVHMRRWQYDFLALGDPAAPPEIVTEDFGAQRFLNDREVWVVAFAPLDADLPLPPQERFTELNGMSIPTFTPLIDPIDVGQLPGADGADVSVQALETIPMGTNAELGVARELLAQPLPEWMEAIDAGSFTPMARTLVNQSLVVVASFAVLQEGVDSASESLECTAAINTTDRSVVAEVCERHDFTLGRLPNFVPTANRGSDGSSLLSINIYGEVMRVETTSGALIATNVVRGTAFVSADFQDDPIAAVTFFDADWNITMECRQPEGGPNPTPAVNLECSRR